MLRLKECRKWAACNSEKGAVLCHEAQVAHLNIPLQILLSMLCFLMNGLVTASWAPPISTLTLHIVNCRNCSTHTWSPTLSLLTAKSSTWRWKETTSATWLRWLKEMPRKVSKADLFVCCNKTIHHGRRRLLCFEFMSSTQNTSNWKNLNSATYC